MANGWSPERRARQSAGPQTADGKARASRNADKGGKRPALRAELAHLREMMRELVAEQREGW